MPGPLCAERMSVPITILKCVTVFDEKEHLASSLTSWLTSSLASERNWGNGGPPQAGALYPNVGVGPLPSRIEAPILARCQILLPHAASRAQARFIHICRSTSHV